MPRKTTRRLSSPLSDELRRILQDEDASGNELAVRFGLDRGQIYRFLSGQRTLTLDSVDKIWTTLGLRVLQPRKGRR